MYVSPLDFCSALSEEKMKGQDSMPLAITPIRIVRVSYCVIHTGFHQRLGPEILRASRLRAHDEKASRVCHRPAHNTVMWDNHQRDWDHKPYPIKHLQFFLQFCLSNHSRVVVALRPHRLGRMTSKPEGILKLALMVHSTVCPRFSTAFHRKKTGSCDEQPLLRISEEGC